MTDVTVTEARRAQAPALARMFQLYWHDFSEFLADPDAELAEDGSFGPAHYLDRYWLDDQCVPLLIRVGGRLAGFALLSRFSRIGDAPDHAVADFFIARRHRRQGIGQRAARMIFDRFPGEWEVAVMRANAGALGFWRAVIGAHAGIRGLVERSGRDGDWDGTLLRFAVLPETAPAPLA